MEKAASQSPEKLDYYQLLAEYAPTAVFIADSHGNYTYVNQAACQWLGYEKVEFLNKKITDIILPDENERLIKFRQDILENQQAVDEWQLLRKDGSAVWSEVHVRLLPDGCELAHVIDISEKKRNESKLKESNERFRKLFEDAPNGIVMVNQQGQIDLVNTETEKMFGYNRDELIGQSIEVLVPERFRRHHQIFRGEFQKKPEARMMGSGRDLFGLRKDGSEFPLEIGLNTVKTNSGEIVFATIIDISQRKQSEIELYKLAAIVESSDDAIISKDLDSTILSWNKGAERTFGYTADEIIGKNVRVLFPPELLEEEEEILEKIKTGEKISNFETVRIRKDGTRFHVSLTISPIRNINGRIIGISKIARDITELKKANEQLLQEKRVADSIINSLPGIFYLFTEEGKYLRWNNNLALISGYSVEEVAQMHPLNLCPEDERQIIGEKIGEALDKGEVFVEGHLLCKDGSKIPHFFTGKKIEIDNVSCVAGMGVDVSERKQAENELYKLAAIVESSDDAIISKDFDGTIQSWNAGAERIFGYTSEEVIGKNISLLFPPDLIEEEAKIIKKIKSGQRLKNYETIRVKKDGTHFPISLTISPIKDIKGNFIGASKICQDITARKQAENQAFKLAAIVESSNDGIISTNPAGQIMSWNRGAEQIFGYSEQEIIGKNVSILFPSDSAQEKKEIIDKAYTDENTNFESIRVRKDGTHFPVAVTISILKDINGQIIGSSAIYRDQTQEKQKEQAYIESEEQLRQSQKVEAVGRLAGGIAHDFNNFLAVIMLHIDMLNLQLPAESSLRYRVSEIKTVTENAAGMVKQLLAFGRKQTLQPQPLVLNQVVKQFMKVLRPLVGEDIDIQFDLETDLGVCFVDPNQINQVLMNLAVNARDAMPKGGKLKIRTENIQLNKGDIRKRRPQPTGAYIQLTVTDTGTGMDPQTQKRVFEPFFTTKEAGKGTGLGLATVYGIIKQSNGFIWVESEQNYGTTFKIQLPRVDQPSIEVKNESIFTFPGGTETILLVEDEEQVRRVAVEVLTVLGYQVFEAGNGTQAIQLAKLYNESIHLLLTDVVMPKMNGKEVAEQIKSIHPEATVLFISGYNDDIIGNHGVLDENLHFLPKPFSPSTLAHKVREVLDLEGKKD